MRDSETATSNTDSFVSARTGSWHDSYSSNLTLENFVFRFLTTLYQRLLHFPKCSSLRPLTA